jgi:membrane dipeptidase
VNLPVADIHCDLLSYLQEVPGSTPFDRDGIGCSLPSLTEGNVKLQVLAIYTATEKGSSQIALKQSAIFNQLLTSDDSGFCSYESDKEKQYPGKISIIGAIENASGFCDEDAGLEEGFKKLEDIIENTGKILYIGFTHHGENRFGGGNTTRIGLKEDGKELLNFLHGKKIAVDLSHASDPLAEGILEHLLKFNLNVPVIASHSNFRKIFDHPRNLPDHIAREIIRRKGLIGINFLRAFLNPENPNAIYDHMQYGLQLGGTESLCFGADYFNTAAHPDQSRKPFFFNEQKNAGCYPSILKNLASSMSREQLQRIAFTNVTAFLVNYIVEPQKVSSKF